MLANSNIFFNVRNEAIKIIENIGAKIIETKRKAKQEKGIKLLTLKQILQRLLLVLAQVKAGDNSEKLLNEIRQVVYSLYQSKGINEKRHNNIIKSIKV